MCTSTTAVVTGANQGLGRALVAGLARRLGDGRFIAAVCPGLVDTDASRPWFDDMSQAQSPDAAAEDVLFLALDHVDRTFHGELVQHRRIVPWS